MLVVDIARYFRVANLHPNFCQYICRDQRIFAAIKLVVGCLLNFIQEEPKLLRQCFIRHCFGFSVILHELWDYSNEKVLVASIIMNSLFCMS